MPLGDGRQERGTSGRVVPSVLRIEREKTVREREDLLGRVVSLAIEIPRPAASYAVEISRFHRELLS